MKGFDYGKQLRFFIGSYRRRPNSFNCHYQIILTVVSKHNPINKWRLPVENKHVSLDFEVRIRYGEHIGEFSVKFPRLSHGHFALKLFLFGNSISAHAQRHVLIAKWHRTVVQLLSRSRFGVFSHHRAGQIAKIVSIFLIRFHFKGFEWETFALLVGKCISVSQWRPFASPAMAEYIPAAREQLHALQTTVQLNIHRQIKEKLNPNAMHIPMEVKTDERVDCLDYSDGGTISSDDSMCVDVPAFSHPNGHAGFLRTAVKNEEPNIPIVQNVEACKLFQVLLYLLPQRTSINECDD